MKRIEGNTREALYKKAALRLIPLLFICYLLAYLDRVNVGFAKLQMSRDLGFSETLYGTAAGIFFIGYLLFEVPSNVILSRVGARIWIARILVTWGAVASLQLFVTGAVSFSVMRFLLGVAEAGFFPGVIFYLTLWFPAAYRARILSWFMLAVSFSGVVGGPVSGFILEKLDGMGGMWGWQWLFLLQGLPAVFMGILVFLVLDDGPQTCRWLDKEEKSLLHADLVADGERSPASSTAGHGIAGAFGNPMAWMLGLIYFCIVVGLYGISFWLPQILAETVSRDPVAIGWLSAIPWAVASLAMVADGKHSDRTGERRLHIAIPCFGAAASFGAFALFPHPGTGALLLLVIAAAGIMSALSVFWTLPPMLLRGTASAVGIALINSIGNIGGYVSPQIVGMLRDATRGHMAAAFIFFAGCLAVAGLLALTFSNEQKAAPFHFPNTP
jgi:sugar phosphate permease